MNINALNKNEWHNPNNWSRMGLLGIYFSKADTRILVPKTTPAFGWTLNFGHRHSVLWLSVIIVLPVLATVTAILVSTAK
ncbi:MAG: DUF5808 domain-containing protein [Arenimonas sp.]